MEATSKNRNDFPFAFIPCPSPLFLLSTVPTGPTKFGTSYIGVPLEKS